MNMAEDKTTFSLFPVESPTSEDIEMSLKPTIICMKIFALYYDNLVPPSKNVIAPVSEKCAYFQNNSERSSETLERSRHSAEITFETPATNRKGRIKYLAQKCYCAFVLLFLCVDFVRFSFSMKIDVSLPLSTRIAYLMFSLQTTCACACIFYSCWTPGHLRTFYEEWAQFYRDPVTRSLGLAPTCCKRVVRIIICGFVIGMAANTIVFLINMFYNKLYIQQALQENLCDPFPVTAWTISLAVVVEIIRGATWLLPLSFVLCLAYIMLVHFNRLTLVIQTHIHQSEGQIPANLKELRKCHLKMCQLLQVSNRFLRSYLGTLYITSLVSCCFILYQMINTRNAQDQIIMDAFVNSIIWLMSNIATIAVVSVGLAYVHGAAHAPLDDLFTIDTRGADVSDCIELQLFLSKLTSTSIGATVFNLLVVTKEFLLTIVGAFITYFFLLIQFRI